MISGPIDWALLNVDGDGRVQGALSEPSEAAAGLIGELLEDLITGIEWTEISDAETRVVDGFQLSFLRVPTGWVVRVDSLSHDEIAHLVTRAHVAELGRGMAHEFNNVLHLALGGVRCLTQVPEQRDEWVRTIRSAVQRGRKLVDTLQPILRVDSAPQKNSVDRVLLQALEALELVLKTATITPEVGCPDWVLTARPADLFSALVELVGEGPQSQHYVVRASAERGNGGHKLRLEVAGDERSIDLVRLGRIAERLSAEVQLSGDRPALLIPARPPASDDISLDDSLCLVIGEMDAEHLALLESRGGSLLKVDLADAASVAEDYLEEIDVVLVGRGSVNMEWVLRVAGVLRTRRSLPVLVVSDVGELLMLRQHHERVVFLPPAVPEEQLLRQVRMAVGQARL